jgi:antitoxin component YwqK of YwqJK toxin-antitoxin module
MKKSILLIAAICLAFSAQAKTLFDQLVEYNPHWKKYESRAPKGKARKFKTDAEYVQTHLTGVLFVLKTNPTKHLNKQQLTSRKNMIKILTEYRDRGRFPMNEFHENRTPVFIDRCSTHCAVGYLLKETGNQAVAFRISRKHNYDWLIDIKDEALPGWQKSSGLTVEELKLIQGAYDFYRADAFIARDKYDIPQQPRVLVAHFGRKAQGRWSADKEKNIWCYGEGEDGVLHGKWIQNYSSKLPWIEGFYNKGKRTGHWKEYYQGTELLCRTEHWRDDKLNGVRTRYDRDGKIIEEILFRNGKAVVKTNYDYHQQFKYVRKPLETGELNTEVFTLTGALLGKGLEVVDNPDNLQWFQNIELTALNSFAISAREGQVIQGKQALFQASAPHLVQYKRQGQWEFYTAYTSPLIKSRLTKRQEFNHDFPLLQQGLHHFFNTYSDKMLIHPYRRIEVVYKDGQATEFIGHHNYGVKHLVAEYYWPEKPKFPENYEAKIEIIRPYYIHGMRLNPYHPIKYVGEINAQSQKIGTWAHFDKSGNLCRKEEFIQPEPYLERATASN